MSTDRIQQLEDQVARLQSEIATLRGNKPTVVPPPVDRAGVRVTQLVEPSSFIRPTRKELSELLAVVVAKYPKLGPPKTMLGRNDGLEAEDFAAGFEWAFERLGFIGRAAVPDTKHYVGHWVEECKEWLRLHRPAHRGSVGAAFLCAAIAHRDIPYTVGDEQRGIVWSIGVTTHGGTKASDAWRKVLNGDLMPPVMPERRYG